MPRSLTTHTQGPRTATSSTRSTLLPPIARHVVLHIKLQRVLVLVIIVVKLAGKLATSPNLLALSLVSRYSSTQAFVLSCPSDKHGHWSHVKYGSKSLLIHQSTTHARAPTFARLKVARHFLDCKHAFSPPSPHPLRARRWDPRLGVGSVVGPPTGSFLYLLKASHWADLSVIPFFLPLVSWNRAQVGLSRCSAASESARGTEMAKIKIDEHMPLVRYCPITPHLDMVCARSTVVFDRVATRSRLA